MNKLLLKNSQPIDITTGPITKGILIFFFPILFGTFFQQLYNTADAIIVGRFLGKEALAAVGGGTATVVNLLIGFFVGLSSGATVIISQFFGAKLDRKLHNAVHTAFALAIVGGFIISILGIIFSPMILKLLHTPQEILEPSIRYIRIFFAGVIPGIIYNMGSGILRAIGDSKRPFYILVIGSFINILMDLLFIAVLPFGVEGAAIATITSELITMILVCLCLMRTTNSYKLILKDIKFDLPILSQTLRIGLPTGFQSILYTISNLIIQSNINDFGTNTIAAWAAYGKIDSIFWMSINSFGIAVMTFTGQNYGAKQFDRIKSGVNKSLIITSVGTIIMSGLFCLLGKYFYSLFTTDEDVIKEGMVMLNFIAPTFITYISIEILSGAIRGCGKSLFPTVITCLGVCLLRIVWLYIAVPINPKLETVCASYPISWIITSLLFWVYYISKRWLKSS